MGPDFNTLSPKGRAVDEDIALFSLVRTADQIILHVGFDNFQPRFVGVGVHLIALEITYAQVVMAHE